MDTIVGTGADTIVDTIAAIAEEPGPGMQQDHETQTVMFITIVIQESKIQGMPEMHRHQII